MNILYQGICHSDHRDVVIYLPGSKRIRRRAKARRASRWEFGLKYEKRDDGRDLRMVRSANALGKSGRVLNISSVAGYSANPTLAFYSAGTLDALYSTRSLTEAFTRKMPPSWNIKGIIIEPGGFLTNWRDGNTVLCPADYPPDAPSRIFREMADTHAPIGDLTKAARAMIRMAEEKDPPMRVQLGTDSFGIVCHQARKTLREAEMWQEVAHSTNLDSIDRSKVLDGLKAALG